MKKRLVTILGATGSIGQSTLKVMALHPEQFQLFALTAYDRVEAMVALIERYQPRYAVMANEQAAEALVRSLNNRFDTEILAGSAGLEQVAAAAEVDIVMAAIVGAAGLLPTLAAAQAGKRILFANKEVLVMAGACL